MDEYSGKVALVTGSTMGLGKAIALGLAKLGVRVIINDPIGGDDAKKVVSLIKDLGAKCHLAVGDVADSNAVEKIISNIVLKFSKVDILINNAGISIDARTVNYPPDAWEKVIGVNLNGAFLCAKYCLPSMLRQEWGRIINIGSVAGLIGIPGAPAYSTSKAGLIGLTKTLAKEVGRKRITVNCLALGYIQGGGLFDTISKKLREKLLDQIPVGRWGQPEDVIHAINFLISENASYITGQTIEVNGGLHV
jgi:3-oxoacyl-[acyl-carrier protein] reductase